MMTINKVATTYSEKVASIKATLSKQDKERQGRPIRYVPFSRKQKQILTWWHPSSPVRNKEGIIADGSIRSGKTTSMALSYGLWAMHNFDGENFLMCGKTIGSLRRNVITGWRRQMRAEGYRVKDRRQENMLIVSKNGITNFFYLFGGSTTESQDLVQGITAAGALFDEVVLMVESFVEQAVGRCSVDGSKFWFNCNPGLPAHWFKKQWIDKLLCNKPEGADELDKEGNPLYKDLIYLHFTMDDNPSLTERIRRRYRTMYAGVFYMRFILGLWCAAEGVVYEMFDDDNIYDDAERPENLEHLTQRTISVDYGTANPCVFLDIYDDGVTIWIDNEYRWDSRSEEAKRAIRAQKTDSEYGDEMEKFMGTEYLCDVLVDPSAASFIAELKRRLMFVSGANNEVINGIRALSTLMQQKKIKIHRTRCAGLINELRSYVWDEKAIARGEEAPMKQHDHGPDALRYYCYTKLPSWRIGIKKEE